jgi:glycosyltransferase involved in cell wall biosynthesis
MVLLRDAVPDDLRRDISAGTAPRPEFLVLSDLLGATIQSRSEGDRWIPSPVRSWLGRRAHFASAIGAILNRARYDRIYATGEDVGIPLLFGLGLLGWKGRVHFVVHACNSTRRETIFRLLGHRLVGQIICVCNAQVDILVKRVGFPERAVDFYYNWVDCDYFNPEAVAHQEVEAYAFACGFENRDYGTLERAAQISPHRINVQASGFLAKARSSSGSDGGNFRVNSQRISSDLLREMYAGAKFVVVPLNAVPYAAGVTGILEAMAMGKALIVTESPGIADYVIPDVSALVIPQNDPRALATAIDKLWSSPDLCEQMGRHNRTWALEHASVDAYAKQVAATMENGARTEC